MKPVVVDPTISFTQLTKELTSVSTPEAALLVRDQFIAKLQRKKRHLKSDEGRARLRDRRRHDPGRLR
jgi:type I restriction enzyme R subunit